MPEWITPLLWLLWCAAITGSFSITSSRSPGRAESRARAVLSPTIPAPITITSAPALDMAASLAPGRWPLPSGGVASEVIDGLRAEREAVLGVCRSLTAEEWELPSDCEGWRVRDVAAHLSSIFHPTLTAFRLLRQGVPFEQLNDRLVDLRRSWPVSDVLAEYERWGARALRLLSLVQRPPVGRLRVPMGELGRHQLRMAANATLFDHFTHLRVDLLQPFGPLDRPVPDPDPVRLRPITSWLLELVPFLCRESLAWLDGPVALRLHGPGGGEWTVSRQEQAIEVTAGDSQPVAATVVSTTSELVVWATKRRDWRTRDVEIEGDRDLGERFADSIHLY